MIMNMMGRVEKGWGLWDWVMMGMLETDERIASTLNSAKEKKITFD
jgi:hypothetical protein